jgi:hypothetical protein
MSYSVIAFLLVGFSCINCSSFGTYSPTERAVLGKLHSQDHNAYLTFEKLLRSGKDLHEAASYFPLIDLQARVATTLSVYNKLESLIDDLQIDGVKIDSVEDSTVSCWIDPRLLPKIAADHRIWSIQFRRPRYQRILR